VQYSVRKFVEAAASQLGMDIRWEGSGLEERGYAKDGRPIVAVDPRYFRPAEVDSLLGDATKARIKLGWAPRIGFEQLVEEMVREDFDSAQRDDLAKRSGFKTYDFHE